MMRYWMVLVIALMVMKPAVADDKQTFERLFDDWTEAFNQQQLAPSCALFSPSVIATYQGAPAKNFSTICDGFKKIFGQHDKKYEYRYKLHQIYRQNDIAAIRITWYLRVYQQGKVVEQTQDEGLDVFRKNPAGKWQIVNYLAYPDLHN